MGRVEKKFQKKKERERAVRKKILKRREVSRELARQAEQLEKSVVVKSKPIRRASPELQKASKLLDELEVRGVAENVVMVDDTTICNTDEKNNSKNI